MDINHFLGLIRNKFIAFTIIFLPLSLFASDSTNILFIDSKQCLTTENFSIAARLIINNCVYNDNQQFIIKDNLIKSTFDQSQCLTINSDAVGAPVILLGCENKQSNKQNFIVQDKIYLLANKQLCLAKEQNSNKLILNTCDSSSKVSIATTINTYDQKCLHFDSSADNTLLISKNCDLSFKQKFFIDSNNIRTALDVNKCLDSVYFNENINTIFLKPCLEQPVSEQKFRLQNDNIKRGESDKFCFTYFPGVHYDVTDPIVLAKCADNSSDYHYLKQKFSIG